MFLDFFFKLKNAKIPVSLNEFLNLLNALDNQIKLKVNEAADFAIESELPDESELLKDIILE